MTIKEFFGMMPNDPNFQVNFQIEDSSCLEFTHIDVEKSQITIFFTDEVDNNVN